MPTSMLPPSTRSLMLVGKVVRLEPVGVEHADGILAAGAFDALWTVTVMPPLVSTDAVRAYVTRAIGEREGGREVPFVIVHNESNQVVGATRWMDIAWEHRRLEIGGTWVTPAFQRTGKGSFGGT